MQVTYLSLLPEFRVHVYKNHPQISFIFIIFIYLFLSESYLSGFIVSRIGTCGLETLGRGNPGTEEKTETQIRVRKQLSEQ